MCVGTTRVHLRDDKEAEEKDTERGGGYECHVEKGRGKKRRRRKRNKNRGGTRKRAWVERMGYGRRGGGRKRRNTKYCDFRANTGHCVWVQ